MKNVVMLFLNIFSAYGTVDVLFHPTNAAFAKELNGNLIQPDTFIMQSCCFLICMIFYFLTLLYLLANCFKKDKL